MAKADPNGMKNAAGIAYGDLIRRQRKAKKMNQEDLGALVSVGKNAVGAWEAGRSRPDVASVPVICEALDLSLDEFFGFTGLRSAESSLEQNELDELARKYARLNDYNRRIILREMDMLREMQESMHPDAPPKVIRIFRNDLAASAGTGEVLDAVHGEEAYLFANPLTEAADEIIRVNGNSMEPTYYDGDLVLVKHSSSVRTGEIGVFICGNTGYIKESRKDGLYSHNPAFPVMTFAMTDEVHCVGRVLGKAEKEFFADENSYHEWIEYERMGK